LIYLTKEIARKSFYLQSVCVECEGVCVFLFCFIVLEI